MHKLYDVNPFDKDFEDIDPSEDFVKWINFLDYRKEQAKKSRRYY